MSKTRFQPLVLVVAPGTNHAVDPQPVGVLEAMSAVPRGIIDAGDVIALVFGFRDMAYAALLLGFARGIYVVLNDGLIVDTIVHGQ